MIILACASIPGYWVAVFAVDTIGRKPLQIIGFGLLAVLFCVLGFTLHILSEHALLGLYVLSQFLFNAGPNTTTFIVAGECFPTRYRSTAHGFAAAVGKLGAVVAQGISIPLLHTESLVGCEGRECSANLHILLKCYALCMVLGALFSLLIPETKGLTLEELSGETRTSYSAGCNGSIDIELLETKAWNPFKGGRPAGFNYPRNHLPNLTNRPRSSTESVRRRRPTFWRPRRRGRTSTDEANDVGLANQSSPPESSSRTSEQTTSASFGATGLPSMTQANLPVWGAGWGRIDRGKQAPRLEELQLTDVGGILERNR